MFDDLNTFKAQNGHFKDLGRWVNVQKVSHKKNALNSNYIQQLNSISVIIHGMKHLTSYVRSKYKTGIVMYLKMMIETNLWEDLIV